MKIADKEITDALAQGKEIKRSKWDIYSLKKSDGSNYIKGHIHCKAYALGERSRDLHLSIEDIYADDWMVR